MKKIVLFMLCLAFLKADTSYSYLFDGENAKWSGFGGTTSFVRNGRWGQMGFGATTLNDEWFFGLYGDSVRTSQNDDTFGYDMQSSGGFIFGQFINSNDAVHPFWNARIGAVVNSHFDNTGRCCDDRLSAKGDGLAVALSAGAQLNVTRWFRLAPYVDYVHFTANNGSAMSAGMNFLFGWFDVNKDDKSE